MNVFAWLLLHVYVLVNVLDFVIVLFRSGVFDHILVHSGWEGGGSVVHIFCKPYSCTPRKKSFGGLRTC